MLKKTIRRLTNKSQRACEESMARVIEAEDKILRQEQLLKEDTGFSRRVRVVQKRTRVFKNGGNGYEGIKSLVRKKG